MSINLRFSITVYIYQTEMLVFMEYCDRGTLDEVSRVGLPEHLVRRYTRELLIAVIVLHDHKIVHREQNSSWCLNETSQ